MKVCSGCGVPKELSDFHTRKRSKSGYASECKSCHSERGKKYGAKNKEKRKKYYEANKELRAAQGRRYRELNKARLSEQSKKYYEANKELRAEQNKKWREANKNLIAEQNKEKWRKTDKERESERSKKYYEANKERLSEQSKKWREDNKESIKKYLEANKDRRAEYTKKYREVNKDRRVEYNKKYYAENKELVSERFEKWRKANPDKDRSSTAKRRSIKLQAHPPWAATLEKRQIEGIYTLAKIQSEATGKKYHVDHIHPLQATKVVMFEGEMIPLICGLHVPANLQILEASDNCSKSNKFEPYIESECDFTELWQVRSNDRTLIPTPIDRVPRRNPSVLIKPRKSRGVSKGQLALF